MGRLKKFFAETDEKFYVLVSRDTRCISYAAALKGQRVSGSLRLCVLMKRRLYVFKNFMSLCLCVQLKKFFVFSKKRLSEGVDVDDGEDHEDGDDGEGYLEVALKLATEDDGVEGALLEAGGSVTMVVVMVMRRRIRMYHLTI